MMFSIVRKSNKLNEDEVLCKFCLDDLLWISDCLNDRVTELESDVKVLYDELMLSNSDVINCEVTYSELKRVNDIKNKIDSYIQQINAGFL